MNFLMDTISSMGSSALWRMRFEFTCAAAFLGLMLLRRLSGQFARAGPSAGRKMQPTRAVQPLQGMRNSRRPPSSTQSKVAAATTTSVAEGKLSMDTPTDPEALVAHISRMSRNHFHRGLDVYRSALNGGLDFKRLAPADLEQILVTLVASAIRTGCPGGVLQVLQDLRKAGMSIPEGVFASAVKLCTSKQLFAESLDLYDFAFQDRCFQVSDRAVWSCLLFCALETGHHTRCPLFFEKVKAFGEPTVKDYGNMVRHASNRADWELAMRLIEEMRSKEMEVDSVIYNSALAICVSTHRMGEARKLLATMEQTKGATDAITYNTLMKGFARAGDVDGCFRLFEQMHAGGIAASQVTYGILLDVCINENLMEKAAEVFGQMVKEGCPMNTVLYTTLIKGFSRAQQVDRAMEVYEKMRANTSMSPDVVTYSVLIKAFCDASRMEEAMKLLSEMVAQGLAPDEIIFNNLLAGCAVRGDEALGRKMYADMIAAGIRPSCATFSIFIRLLVECKKLDDALEMLETEPQKRGVQPESRLYVQLIQSCIRERHGRKAVETYQAMTMHFAPPAAVHSSILSTCAKLNMFDTARQVLVLAAEGGWRVDTKDINSLLEAALKKRKAPLARGCLEAAEMLGIKVEAKLVTQVRTGGC